MTVRGWRGWLVAGMLLTVMCGRQALAAATLLVEDPYGRFGEMNPTGHAAIYLDHVCAESPTRLRMCRPGEAGAVISRYHHVAGYDWLAVPALPYFYAVTTVADVPEEVTPEDVAALRDTYRRRFLEEIAPDGPEGETPKGEWIQLVGAAYDREIHGFRVETTREADARLVARFNSRRNVSHFNLFVNNCADLSRGVLNFYYPHTVDRSFLSDFGFTTPKHLARRLSRAGRRRPEMELSMFVILQVPGTVERSGSIKGIGESLLKSKKYVAPLLYFYPEFTGGLALAYFGTGRYTFPRDVPVWDAAQFAPAEARPATELAKSAVPALEFTDGEMATAKDDASGTAASLSTAKAGGVLGDGLPGTPVGATPGWHGAMRMLTLDR